MLPVRLQQHKLLKVMKKKLIRKALDMIDKETYDKFWKVRNKTSLLLLVQPLLTQEFRSLV